MKRGFVFNTRDLKRAGVSRQKFLISMVSHQGGLSSGKVVAVVVFDDDVFILTWPTCIRNQLLTSFCCYKIGWMVT